MHHAYAMLLLATVATAQDRALPATRSINASEGSINVTRLSTLARFPERQATGFYEFRPGDETRPPAPDEIATIRRKRGQHAARVAEAAGRLPAKAEVDALFRREWSAAGPYRPLGTSFGFPRARFGEVHDLLCDRERGLFRCVIGVTFLHSDKLEYGRLTVLFKRDLQHRYALQRFEDEVDVEDVLVGPPRKRPSVVNRILDLPGPGPLR